MKARVQKFGHAIIYIIFEGLKNQLCEGGNENGIIKTTKFQPAFEIGLSGCGKLQL